MNPVNATAYRVLEHLYNLAKPKGHAKVNNSDGVYMPVSVDMLGDNTMAVAHNFEQNGDLVPDPDMTFWKDGLHWYALSIQHSTGHHTQAVSFGENGRPETVNRAKQADLTAFANQWMKNIKAQQELKL
jgi:hypothetical protein